jgi:hypothetical protein
MEAGWSGASMSLELGSNVDSVSVQATWNVPSLISTVPPTSIGGGTLVPGGGSLRSWVGLGDGSVFLSVGVEVNGAPAAFPGVEIDVPASPYIRLWSGGVGPWVVYAVLVDHPLPKVFVGDIVTVVLTVSGTSVSVEFTNETSGTSYTVTDVAKLSPVPFAQSDVSLAGWVVGQGEQTASGAGRPSGGEPEPFPGALGDYFFPAYGKVLFDGASCAVTEIRERFPVVQTLTPGGPGTTLGQLTDSHGHVLSAATARPLLTGGTIIDCQYAYNAGYAGVEPAEISGSFSTQSLPTTLQSGWADPKTWSFP